MTPRPGELSIEVRGLSKSFRAMKRLREMAQPSRRIRALDGIDLEVRRGEIFGLLGPNGAGKTTLVKILCGLVLADAGTVRILGLDPAEASGQFHRVIGVVYGDERSFQWRISVRDNLRFFARLYGLPAKSIDGRIDELLDLVGLSHAEDRRMLAFSSGMRQRAAIARGLLHDPDVVLMDEPTRMLDPVGTHDVHTLIRERVATADRTVLLATNTMSEAEALCDRLLLLRSGRQVLAGRMDELRAAVAPTLTYRLEVDGPMPTSEGLLAIDGIDEVEVLQPAAGGVGALRLLMHRHSTALPVVIRAIVEAGGEIVGCNREDITLDQIFRDVVRSTSDKAAVRA